MSRHRARAVALLPLGALVLAVAPAAGSAAAAAPEPALRLVAASSSVTIDRYPDDDGVYLDLGAHVVAGRSPFELRVSRRSYAHPIVASQVVRRGTSVTTKPLPAGLVRDFGGLSRFFRLTLTDGAGRKVLDRHQSFCPSSYGTSRARPDAPARSPYPQTCGGTPFALAGVWGMQAGWATPTEGSYGESVSLPDGAYRATVEITPTYRRLFGIPAGAASTSVAVTIRTHDDTGGPGHGHATAGTRTAVAKAAGPRPTGRAPAVRGLRPDLRSLPAWGIEVTSGAAPGDPGPTGDYLAFAANVWNAGPAPLVVDGFRRPGTDLMDAYQYFYNDRGQQVGWAPTGTLEYDSKDGHEHWHFTDFARYRLLKADKKVAVLSGKEAFCLAPTDAIDLTVRGARWKPGSTGLETACGGRTALSIRETLDVGWGDTYSQSLPGQSFDITQVPNGTYYIEVTANPDKRLHETSLANNVSLRKVVLGGTPGARTVTVPPYQLINAP